VLAVAGTHGKTTTSSLLAWILEEAGLKPGFLIGGVPQNFGVSARLGFQPLLRHRGGRVRHGLLRQALEVRPLPAADRHPEQSGVRSCRHLRDLAAIETQFHHFVRILPKSGLIVANAGEPA
jgi:UDP-N-acetylmuramate: L-alanyl-gamma-D-glutamyl-meso-diaminopimelate ligase